LGTAVEWRKRLLERSEAECPEPLSFGLIADVQYADQDAWKRRHFREAIHKLEECVADLNTRELDFTIQLGDIVDEGADSLDRVLAAYGRLDMPTYHVLGNHDFVLPRPELLDKLRMDRAYHSFSRRGWRFIVLDAQDLGVGYGWSEESDNYRRGAEMLERLRQQEAANAEDWNGGIGPEQTAWLEKTLREAAAVGEKSIIFCHMPILAEAADPGLLLWNHEEMVKVLESTGLAAAVFGGHDHDGGCACRNGIHYITVQGMVESPERNAYAVVTLHEDRIIMDGIGDVPDRVLPLLTLHEDRIIMDGIGDVPDRVLPLPGA
jgi:3',5'-cyclic AMP phosphodiesterase CpdA